MSLVLLFNQPAAGTVWVLPPPPDWTVYIAGVDVSMAIAKRSLRMELTRGAPGSASCDLIDWRADATAYRPNVDDEFVWWKAGVPIFGGYITDAAESPIAGLAGGTKTSIKVGHYARALDNVFVTASFGSQLIPILNSVGNPANLTTDGPHGLTTGQRVLIEGHQSSVPNLNGIHVVTETGFPNNVTVPVALTAAGGAGTLRRVWTLKEVITALMPNLAPLGFTLDPTMVDGPYLSPIDLVNVKFSEFLNHILDETGLISRVSPARVLSVFEPGTRVAPFSLDGANTPAPVQWQKTRAQYANRVLLEIGGTSKMPATQLFVASGVADPSGSTRYVTDYPASQDINGDAWPNVLIVNGAVIGPVSWGPDVSFAWYWDFVNHALVHNDAVGVYPPAGSLITVGYTAQFPVTIEAHDVIDMAPPPAGRGPWTIRDAAPNVTNLAQGQAIADGLLRRSKQDSRALQTGTTQGLAYPGDKMALTYPRRLVAGDWMIESVRVSLWSVNLFYYDYTFTEGLNVPKTWIDAAKQLTGGSSSGSSINIGGALPVVSPTNPPSLPVPAIGVTVYFLGGTSHVAVQGEAGTWIPVTGDPIGQSAMQATIDVAAPGTVRVRLKAAAAGVTVRARLWRVDGGGSDAGQSIDVTSQVWTTVTIAVAVTPGTYELHVRPSVTGADVFGVGNLEI